MGTLQEKVYRIQDDPICGRQLVAARRILAGELIIDEPALLTGPGYLGGTSSGSEAKTLTETDPSSVVVCLVCCRNVSSVESFTCPSCDLSLCSESCRNDKQHVDNECLVFPRIKHVWNARNPRSKKSFYNLILVIRALFYKLRDSKKWDQIQLLESKKEALEKVGAFMELEDVFSCLTWDLFFSVLSTSSSNSLHPEMGNENISEAAKHILGVLRVNAFSSFSESYSREGLFFLSSLMSHCCIVNTDRQMEVSRNVGVAGDGSGAATDGDFLSGSRLVVRASVDIQKDQPITTTYLSLLYNTEERHRIMISNWLFVCHCRRCQDPEECGAFTGTILCQCSNDNVRNTCTCISSEATKNEVGRLLQSRPRSLSNIMELELWLDKNDTGILLHPHYSYFAHIKLFLCQYYGRQNEGVASLSEDQLKRKILYCQQVLNVYERIIPGIQTCRGVILFELWCALERCSELKLLPLKVSCPFKNSVSASNTCSISTTSLYCEKDIEEIKIQALENLKYALPHSSEEAMANILGVQ